MLPAPVAFPDGSLRYYSGDAIGNMFGEDRPHGWNRHGRAVSRHAASRAVNAW
jgi:hypothetical protein